WTDTFSGVQVVGGAFSVKLGSGAAPITDGVLSYPQLYLDVQVQGRQLAGRQQLLHVPYAANSSGDFRVNGTLLAGATADGGTLITDGGFSEVVVGAMKVTTPAVGAALTVNGNSLDSTGTLRLQPSGCAATF